LRWWSWQYSLWSGVCYVTPLLGGWIADSYLGRYRSIMLFSSVGGGGDDDDDDGDGDDML
jgi:hypothetical protein